MVRLIRQKAHPHKKKKDSEGHSRTKLKTVFKFILAGLIVTLIGAGFQALKYMLVDSDYFYIKRVDVRFYNYDRTLTGSSLDDVNNYNVIHKNIFLVNLNEVKGNIEKNHPEFKDVMIRRALPDRLMVQVRRRKPIAQLRSDRFYLVDDEGFILPDARNVPEEGLPIISGMKAPHPKKENIDTVINLIKLISSHRHLSTYKLKSIDCADPRNISFFLDAGNVEIKIGDSEFAKRLDTLATVLEHLKSDIERIKYIDLRFEDPILGPR